MSELGRRLQKLQPGGRIDWLIEQGFASDVLDMLVGPSEYVDADAFDALDMHSRILRRMTLRYLHMIVNEARDSAQPRHSEYFTAWKLAACPGISPGQLDRLIGEKINMSRLTSPPLQQEN